MNAMRLAQTLASNPFFQFAKLGTVNKNSEEHVQLGFDSFLKITLVLCMLAPCLPPLKRMQRCGCYRHWHCTAMVGKSLLIPAEFLTNDPRKGLFGYTPQRPQLISTTEWRTR